MIGRVAKRSAAYNNAAGVADSWARTAAKLAYYQALKMAYGFAGRCTQASPDPHTRIPGDSCQPCLGPGLGIGGAAVQLWVN